MGQWARPRGFARGALLVALAAPLVAGCFADPTEVVVIVDTDAKVGRDFTEIDFCFSSGEQASADGSHWPVTIGARTEGTSTSTFNVLVKLSTTFGSPCFFNGGPMSTQTPTPVFAARTASEVHFVDGEMRSLFIPILKSCACVDSSGMPSNDCSHALDPECHDLSNPPLGDFDEDNLPHLPASAKTP